MVIPPQFQAAADFHEGVARAYVWTKAVCISGRQYTKDDAPEYVFRLPGSSATTSCLPEDGQFGLIDKKGTIVVPFRFYWLGDLSEGLAVARIDREVGGKYGYIDRTGAVVIRPTFNQADSFAEGLAGVEVSSRIEDKKVVDIERGYIDRSGRVVIPAVYEFVGPFSGGLARVAVRLGSQMGIREPRKERWSSPLDSERHGIFLKGWLRCAMKTRALTSTKLGPLPIKDSRAYWPFSDGPCGSSGNRDLGQVYIDRKGRTVARYN